MIVHPHFHRRRTGITRHVEEIVRALGPGAVAVGHALSPQTPQQSLSETYRRISQSSGGVIWHAHRLNELFAGLIFRFIFGARLKVVFTRHAATKPSWWTRFWLTRADAVIALTEDSKKTLGLAAAHVIGHGVDFNVFTPGTAPRSGAGVIGRVRPSKGQRDLVEAAAPLFEKYPGFNVKIIGLVESSEREWAASLERSSRGGLTFTGEQRDIAPWYRALSIVVQPSHSEGFGLVLLEAMASGCCVIATRLPHVPDIIEHGRTGLLYEPGDITSLRALLNKALENEKLAHALGANARREVIARFGLERELEFLRALYSTLSA